MEAERTVRKVLSMFLLLWEQYGTLDELAASIPDLTTERQRGTTMMIVDSMKTLVGDLRGKPQA